jgi:hypothetical protein
MTKTTRLTVWTVRRRDHESLLGDAPVPSEVRSKIAKEAKDSGDVKKRQAPYTAPVTAEALRYTVI